jgi:hypothetical protein
MALVDDQVTGEWKGTSTALLEELRQRVPPAALRTRESARGLTAALARLAPTWGRRVMTPTGQVRNGKRITRITRLNAETRVGCRGRLQTVDETGSVGSSTDPAKANNGAGLRQTGDNRDGCFTPYILPRGGMRERTGRKSVG